MGNRVPLNLGEELYRFNNFNEYKRKNKMEQYNNQVTQSNTLAIDTDGNICVIEDHFVRAKKHGLFPVTFYRMFHHEGMNND